MWNKNKKKKTTKKKKNNEEFSTLATQHSFIQIMHSHTHKTSIEHCVSVYSVNILGELASFSLLFFFLFILILTTLRWRRQRNKTHRSYKYKNFSLFFFHLVFFFFCSFYSHQIANLVLKFIRWLKKIWNLKIII